MIKQSIKPAVLFLIAILVFVSCKKEKNVTTPVNRNKPLIANAGVDQTIMLPGTTAALDGSSSSGSIVMYLWSQISGPNQSVISNSSHASTVVNNLIQGIYLFELKVNDNGRLSAKDTVQISVIANKPPVANAGPDVSFMACNVQGIFVELNGSASADPDNNIVKYSWIYLYGPPGYILKNSELVKAGVENLSAGKYAFELTIIDAGGYSSKDTVLITAIAAVKGYDLDITLNTSFSFINNYSNGNAWDPDDYDLTIIGGKTTLSPLGEFNILIDEYADSTELSDIIYASSMNIEINTASPGIYIVGEMQGINFKKLIRQGGGSFSGGFTVTSGSAEHCDANVLTNLPTVTLTGNLDVGTHTVTLKIKGKVYF